MMQVNLMLALAVATLAVINWLEPGLGGYKPVTELHLDEIARVELIHRGEPRFVLQRGHDGWHGTEGSARENHMQNLLQISQLPSLYRFPLAKEALDQYGLDAPVYQLQFNEVTLTFGGTDPVSKLRYLAVGDTIHLVSDGYYHYLSRSPFGEGK